jgi:hypothetical protein
MWGIPGAILSVPMLAISKIICDRVRPLAAFGHFSRGETQPLSEARAYRIAHVPKASMLGRIGVSPTS